MASRARKNVQLTFAALVAAACAALIWRNTLLVIGVPSERVALAADLATAAARRPAKSRVGVPTRIRIPSIGVNAVVEQVALAKDGSMDVPTRPRDAAWYGLGPRPGEGGSAVLAGHVNWLYGATAVFARLHALKPGDVIVVQDDAGATVSFTVRESKNYDASSDATDIFRSNDGKAHLNLITCDGTWDKRAKQYTKRLVVFADITAAANPASPTRR